MAVLVPKYRDLIVPTYKAIIDLGGSGTNDEICEKVISILRLSSEIIEEPHLGSIRQTELQYQLAWARTYLKNYKVIANSSRSVWSIMPNYTEYIELNVTEVISKSSKLATSKVKSVGAKSSETELLQELQIPIEVKPWREKLSEVLLNMDPYSFERLTQRLLRECGFDDVKVTQKSGDGGIDGTGKLKINGIFSFNIAFQCKRYKGKVSSGDIRNFRGSLSTDIEKGVFITTGTFSRDALLEASNPGKKQIDLINGDELINKLAEFNIGVKEVKDYEIDIDFFNQQ